MRIILFKFVPNKVISVSNGMTGMTGMIYDGVMYFCIIHVALIRMAFMMLIILDVLIKLLLITLNNTNDLRLFYTFPIPIHINFIFAIFYLNSV